jgi:hypothetical protein
MDWGEVGNSKGGVAFYGMACGIEFKLSVKSWPFVCSLHHASI